MSAWLVTGGAGFIGSNFVRMGLGRSGDKIVVLDALTYAGDLTRIADLIDNRKIEFIKGDICDTKLVEDLFSRYKVSKVIHFAAESHVDRSILGPETFIKTNIEGTFTLLEAARKQWQNTDHLFLHVSTDEVFGSLKLGEEPFNENTLYNPSSPYSASKAASDHLVRSWYHTYGLPTIVSNCSNNFGPWQYPEKLIPLMILNAVNGKELPIYGDGLQIRDWLHVYDHCEALLTIIERGHIGETYCIGGNCERSNLHIVQCVCECVDKMMARPKGSTITQIKHITDRLGHDRRYAINSTKLQSELGWKPRYNIDSSLPDIIQWYIAHMDWIEALS